jgi:hypothetical protein
VWQESLQQHNMKFYSDEAAGDAEGGDGDEDIEKGWTLGYDK